MESDWKQRLVEGFQPIKDAMEKFGSDLRAVAASSSIAVKQQTQLAGLREMQKRREEAEDA